MKKYIALMMAALMLFALVACAPAATAPAATEAAAPAAAEAAPAEAAAPAAEPAEAKTVKIGLCVPLTGSMASSGEYSLQGVELAINKINNEGGLDIGGEKYVIELVKQDNEGKPDITINAFNKLIFDDKVVGIVGTNASGTTMAAGPLATEAKVCVVATTATNADVTSVGGDYVFRACGIDPYQGYISAKLAYDYLGFRKGAVIFNNADDYSTGIKDVFVESFEAMGGEVMTQAYAGAEVKDFKAQISAIKEFGGEFIFIEAQAAEIALPIRQIRELGLTEAIIGAYSWDNELIVELAGKDVVEGCYFLSQFSCESTAPLAVEYVKAFQDAYGRLPNNQSTMSYNALMIIANGLEQCGSVEDPEGLRDAIQNTQLDLPNGHYVFNENRDPQVSANIMIYKDGVATYVEGIE